MADVFTKEERSRVMSRIRSKNTKAELILKDYLKGTYLRYQPKIRGKPDFGNKSKKIAVFVDGCFWHKCPKCFKAPKTNKKYWNPKIDRNVQRDKEVNRKLRKDGWKVLRFWEHDVKKNSEKIAKKIAQILR